MEEVDQGFRLSASHQRDQDPTEIYTYLRYVTQAELDRRKVDQVLDKAIQDLLQFKAIQVVLRDTKVLRSTAHSEQCLHGTQPGAGREYGKSNKKCRAQDLSLILNEYYLLPFNKGCVDKSPFTMAVVYEVPHILTEISWVVKIDFQNGMSLFFNFGYI